MHGVLRQSRSMWLLLLHPRPPCLHRRRRRQLQQSGQPKQQHCPLLQTPPSLQWSLVGAAAGLREGEACVEYPYAVEEIVSFPLLRCRYQPLPS